MTIRSQQPVFIAHAEDASDFARELAMRLRDAGVHAFVDEGQLPVVDANGPSLQRAVRVCPLFIFIVSSRSMERGSPPLTELDWAVAARRPLLGISADGHEHVIPPPEVAGTRAVRGGSASGIARAVAEVRGRLDPSSAVRRWAATVLAALLALGIAMWMWRDGPIGGSAGESTRRTAGTGGRLEAPADGAPQEIDSGPRIEMELGDGGLPLGVWIGDTYAPIVEWAGEEGMAAWEGPGGPLPAGAASRGRPDFGSSPSGLRVPADAGLREGGLRSPGAGYGRGVDSGVGDGGIWDGGTGVAPPCPVGSDRELRDALQLAVNYCLPASQQATIVATVLRGKLSVGVAQSDVERPNIHCVRTVVKRGAYQGRGEMHLTPVSWRGCGTLSVAVRGYR